MEDVQKIKTALESANTIGLYVSDNPDKDTIGSVLAMFFALKNAGKNVFLANPASGDAINSFIPRRDQGRVMFSFLGEASEIFYEKLPDRTNIYLTPQDSLIPPDSFFCETLTGKKDAIGVNGGSFDLLMTLGIHDYKIIEKNFGEDPDALFECDIVNIDNNMSNQNYGDVNFVEDYPCLSQAVACFINLIGKAYENKDVRDSLLFGLLSSPANSKSKKNFTTFKWLIANGGGFDLIHATSPKPAPELKVLEETIRNIDEDFLKRSLIGVSVLTKDIFLSSGATSKDLSFTFEKMKSFFHLPSFVLFWQDKKDSVKGIFYSRDPALTEFIKNHHKGSFKENSGIFLANGSDLPTAKSEIISHFLKNNF
jgi:hypothetical protein